jgi:hypothetical protein
MTMTSDRYPHHGTEDPEEPKSDRPADSRTGTPSEPYDGEGEGETAGTEFAKAPSAALPDAEPSTSFGESSFRSSTPSTYAAADDRHTAPNMLPGRERRRSGLERLVVRLIATGGVVGIGVAIAAILAASKVQGWIIGLVVAIVSVALSAVLWSSRQL